MDFAIIISLLFPLVYGRYIYKTNINPTSIIGFWWLLWLLHLHIYANGFFKIKTETLLMLVVSAQAYCVGAVIGYVLTKNIFSNVHSRYHYAITQESRNIAISILLITALLFSIYGSLAGYSALISGDAISFRNDFYESGGEVSYGNVYLTVLRDVIFKPITYLGICIGMLGLIYSCKLTLPLIQILISLTTIVFYDLAALGRGNVVNAVFLCGLLLIFGLGVKRNSGIVTSNAFIIKRIFPLFFVMSLLAFAYINIISLGRQGLDIVSHFLDLSSYFTIGFALFDSKENVLPQDFDGYIYTLGGVFQFINFITRRMGFELLPGKSMDLQGFYPIGTGVNANAVYTWNIAFFADFGYLGVLLIPLLFGILVGFVFKRWKLTGDASYLSLLSLLMVTSLAGVLEWRLMWMDQFIILLLFAAVTYKSNVPKACLRSR